MDDSQRLDETKQHRQELATHGATQLSIGCQILSMLDSFFLVSSEEIEVQPAFDGI